MKKPADFTIASRGPVEGQAPASAINNNDFFRARYYDLETNEVLPFDQITTRIRRTGEQVKRMSAEMMLDVFFLWQNWEGAYNRKDNFRKWVNENLDVSYSYTWDIIKVVDLVIENSPQLSYEFLRDKLSGLLNKAGIQRLKLVAQIDDAEQKKGILDGMYDGREYSVDEILAINGKRHEEFLQAPTNSFRVRKEPESFSEKRPERPVVIHDAEVSDETPDQRPAFQVVQSQTGRKVEPNDYFRQGQFVYQNGIKYEIVGVDFRGNELLCIPADIEGWNGQISRFSMTDCNWMN